eukprot:m.404752 g.404752  ORF g.404752 m.404752 type:complete len:320 (+) comp20128_c2_seq3:793-1752(+)
MTTEHEVQGWYFGYVPVKLTQENRDVITGEAAEMLFVKLEHFQKRAIDAYCEKKHGAKLASVSPEYKKARALLRRKGKDPVLGDLCTTVVTPTSISFEPKDGEGPKFPSKQIRHVGVAPHPRRNDDERVIGMFVEESTGSFQCHMVMVKGAVGTDKLVNTVEALASGKLKKKAAAAKKKKAAAAAEDDEDARLLVGIGLTRKSSIHVSGAVARRQKKIFLDGKSKVLLKRNVNSTSSLAPLDGDEDDLEDLDEDLFGGDDKKEVHHIEENEIEQMGEVNLAHFDFKDEEGSDLDFGFDDGDLDDSAAVGDDDDDEAFGF